MKPHMAKRVMVLRQVIYLSRYEERISEEKRQRRSEVTIVEDEFQWK